MAVRAGIRTFPALRRSPCIRATAPTPESSPGASARPCPGMLPSPFCNGLGALNAPTTTFRWAVLTTLQRFLYVAARMPARPPGWSRLATAGTCSRSLHQGDYSALTSDQLHGFQALAVTGPSPAGLRRLQAAPQKRTQHQVAAPGSSKNPSETGFSAPVRTETQVFSPSPSIFGSSPKFVHR